VLPKVLPDFKTPVRDLADPAVIWLREVETVFEAMARVRTEPGLERVVYFYVTDSDDRLIGVAPMRRLLLAEPSTLVGELMMDPVFSVRATEPFECALTLFTRHRLLALPVVDGEGRLTAVLDVTGATHALVDWERREAAAKLFDTVGAWPGRPRSALLTSLAIGLILALVAAGFHGVLRRAIAVAFFIPTVVTAAGGAALQAVAIGLESQSIRRSRGIGLRCAAGGALPGSALAGVLVACWLRLLPLAVAVAGSVLVACAAGTALGYAVPRAVHRWRLDPRIASEPFVCALAKLVALSCYLAIAAVLI